MTPTAESIVDDYMRRLEQQLSGLPPDVARDVASQVSEHITAALSAISNPGESDVKRILQEVGSPQSIAKAASAEFPSTHRVSLRTLSFWAYTFWFGALWGFNPGNSGSTDPGLVYVTYVTAIVGSTLIWLKNRRISDRRLRNRIFLSDLAVAAIALAIDFLLPTSVGMLKGPVLLALFAGYFYKTWHIYQAA